MIALRWFTLVLLFTLSCSMDKEPSTQNPQTQENVYPDQESWDATIFITRQGKTVGKLRAGHVLKFSQTHKTVLSDTIVVDFYNEQGRHTTRLTALGGEINDNNQNMRAFGNVKVVSDSGLVLYTDTLKWDNQRQRLRSDVPMMLTTNENDTLYGDAFESDPDLKNYEITNPRGKSKKRIQWPE